MNVYLAIVFLAIGMALNRAGRTLKEARRETLGYYCKHCNSWACCYTRVADDIFVRLEEARNAGEVSTIVSGPTDFIPTGPYRPQRRDQPAHQPTNTSRTD